MKKVAVILSGCGVYDGTEIHEAVITLLAIRQNGAAYQCFAPDIPQMHVINHLSGEPVEGEVRNVLVESARIARGDIKPLAQCNAEEFDALVVPGGFGAAKNLCTFAVDGPESHFDADVMRVCKAFADAYKPAGYACIAPALAAAVYADSVKLTIGTDAGTAAGINALGACHIDCPVDEVVIDREARLVTTPAYMLAEDILQAYKGLTKMVETVLSLK
ncbi:isoprenoid biosynthesis protein ElbB [Alteromonas aestuariivivens]|uniref:Glyoxalase n=1 Tax=Alteromonas aestuariivivens TaxID=1938339 RepID=A0A3D8M5F1_9ALTE|nr:isoprenoid biosynthesis glyoxalase ElbB [Alteromonas aestuariivivens]RDV24765.1 isoprenoid biosynthesis protein ElbB [Alteromonas aestuariivivens]